MKKRFFALALLTAFVANIGTTKAQKLALQLEKDSKFKIEKKSDAKIITSAMGQEMENSSVTTSFTKVNVENVASNVFSVSQTLTKLVLNASAMGQEMSYDSDKKDNDAQLGEVLNKVVNKEIKMTIDGTGKTTNQKTAEKESDEASALSMVGINSGSSNLEITNNALLNQEMKVGNKWLDSSKTKSGSLTTQNSMTYTVTAIENDIATITFEGTKLSDGTMEMMGQEMATSGTAKVTGSLKVNTKTGILIETITIEKGTKTIEAGGMSIPQTTETTTKSTVTKE
jgi:hypothetical protein